METITGKFDQLVSSNLKINNKYVAAAVSVCLLMYASTAAPNLPEYMVKLFDNILFKILVIFLILYVSLKQEPHVSLIVAVAVTVLFLTLNLLKKNKESMAQISGNTMAGVPEYVYSGCGSPSRPSDPVDMIRGKHGEHGEKEEMEGGIGVDGPISGVPDEEIQSLCMHLKKDKNATDIIDSPAMFSELINSNEACNFAAHQYKLDIPAVECAKVEDIKGTSQMFSTLAPAL